MSTPSTLVADRYRLMAMLGAGGMGIVWHAWDERLHRDVALKMLRTQLELTDAERQLATDRAMREARITAGLHHPHAVTVFDVVEHDGQPCIVMQLIESTPLSTLLREHGTLTPSETARTGAQVGSALAAAHKLRIVHRDVKPGNILITADGSAMISDFGISHALGDATITATGMMHGTPAYLAPEVARGLPTSFASDVFSFGSTLYTMLEGAPPFGSDKNAIALLHKVARGEYSPPEHAGPLAPLLREMLAADPKRRPSMTSVVESLTALHDDIRVPPAAVAVDPDSSPDAPAPADPEGVDPEGVDLEGVRTEVFDDVETERIDDVGTERIEGADTERIEDAGTERIADAATAVHDPTVPTVPVDRPTRYEPPTGTTERLGAPAVLPRVTTDAEPAHVIPHTETPPVRPNRWRRRTGVIAGIMVVVAALLVGAILLFNPLQPGAGDAAEPAISPTPTPTTGSPAPPSQAASPSTAPSPTSPPASAQPSATPEPVPPTPEQRAVETVSGYYAMLPGDIDGAWPMMSADYQENHAGGRRAYEAFWGNIADVEIADVSASAPDRAQATLTYFFRDGRVVKEVTSYRLVDEGGLLKIAATDVLSSTEL
ncbi:serine/threonine-protein kinase [Mycetocola miduiensis]|uniref:non-specific serine/threonine protein kinase n=1 Tax=Mycetocola miduiensis TaxID=995034 RepID=A0A1I5BNZ5_9MICO|nr:serine/threonine-protein kinase [Mycetocola miduiensis]SFN76448.1 Serine/threonine protein kinase [Mycetocola miduiensis]